MKGGKAAGMGGLLALAKLALDSAATRRALLWAYQGRGWSGRRWRSPDRQRLGKLRKKYQAMDALMSVDLSADLVGRILASRTKVRSLVALANLRSHFDFEQQFNIWASQR